MVIEILNKVYTQTEFLETFDPIIKKYYGKNALLGIKESYDRKGNIKNSYIFFYYLDDPEKIINIININELEYLYKLENKVKIKSLK